MKAWFVSDIHLRSVNERNGIILLRFLRSLAEDEETTHVFFLGDIFDIWVGDSPYFIDQFAPFIEVLETLKRRGIHIVYFEGNHDFHVDKFWRDRFGAETYSEPHYFPIESLYIRCEHGDYINPHDKAYLRYRGVMRSEFMTRVAHTLPGSWIDRIGQAASRKSRAVRKLGESHEERMRKLIRKYTEETYANGDPFDVLIAGHVHVRDEVHLQCDGHSILSVNLGSWLEQPAAYCLQGKKGRFIDLD